MLSTACLDHLEWPALRDAVFERLASPGARARLHGGVAGGGGVLPRTGDIASARRRAMEVDGLEAWLGMPSAPGGGLSLGAELARVEDVAEPVERARRGALLDLVELAAVDDLLDAARRIHADLTRLDDELLPHADEAVLAAVTALRTRLAGLEPPVSLAESLRRSLARDGEISLSDDASEALGRLRKRWRQAKAELTTAVERILRRRGIEGALSGRYWTEREGRVVLPVRSDAFSRAGAVGSVSGIIHGSSGSGQTLFVEPHELIEPGNALREAAMAVTAEEHRIVARLSHAVGEHAAAVLATLDALVELDRIRARLLLGEAVGGVTPRLVEPEPGVGLWAPGVRHPLMVLAGKNVVPNDLAVRVGTGLIISGPNAGGKTVALKTLGLCVLMAQAGLRIPTAAEATVPLFRTLVTDVGDDQSIAADLSTFSAHMKHVEEALAAAAVDGAGTLVLLDEVAVGTDPDQGAALAEAIVTTLVEAGATLVVTTHYERLKLLAVRDRERFANAAVGFDLAALAPTFRVSVGAPGSSSALAVARRLGLPDRVLDRAADLLDAGRLEVDALLRQLEAEREALRRATDELDAQRRALERERAALERREAGEVESAARRRKKAHDAAMAQLRGLEQELERRRKALRATEPRREGPLRITDPEARVHAREARARLQAWTDAPTPDGGETTPSPRPGDRVHVESLGARGEVVSVKEGRVTVQLGAVRMTVGLGDVRPIDGPPARPKAASSPIGRASTPSASARHFGADADPVDLRVSNVLDLRGARAEEAETMLEVFLDRAIADDEEVVVVRHGYGSGTLRKIVREHLPRLRHVVRHRPGLPAEGGDGVTVVWVRP